MMIVLDWYPRDIVIVDWNCFVIPLLRLKTSKVLYYCSEPNWQLERRQYKCCQKIQNVVVNGLVQLTSAMASSIVMNSAYQAKLF